MSTPPKFGSSLPAQDLQDYLAFGQGLPAELLRVTGEALPTNGGCAHMYPISARWAAVVAWSVTGNAEKASALCGVPAAAINDWRNNAAWWGDFQDHAARLKRSEMDGRMQGLLERALDQVADRLENGDISLHQGVTVRHPVKARDATLISAIMYDKLALMRGQATARVERVDLRSLRGQFAKVIEADQPSFSNAEPQTTDNPAESEG